MSNLDEAHNMLKNWALKEARPIISFLSVEELDSMLKDLVVKSPEEISSQLGGFLDLSQPVSKTFLRNLLTRKGKIHKLELQRQKAEEQEKKVRSNRMTKNFSKIVKENREVCYCMATVHDLVSNCLACGKIVCQAEGEGPCLFCGTWVDDHVDADDVTMVKAVEHRDRLLDYDLNSVQRLGIKDQKADWFEIENDTWQRKETRDIAKAQREYEEEKKIEQEDAIFVKVNLEEGKVGMEYAHAVAKTQDELNDEAQEFLFEQQNHDYEGELNDRIKKRKEDEKKMV